MSLADEQDFARILYYGYPGSGKTTHAGHLAHVGPIVFFEAEPGLKKVAFKRRGIPNENIKPVRSVTSEVLMSSFWKLKQKLDDDPNAYAGAVLDTVTNFVAKEVNRIRTREYDLAIEAADAAGELYTGPPKNKFGNTWDLYGEMTGDVREVIEHYVDLPMHLAFTAHVRRDEDADSGAVSYGPAASPAVQKDLVAYFDCVIRTQRVGEFFIGHTVPGDAYEAKDRLDVLPSPVMNLPTMDRIVAYINGDLTEDNDPVQQEWLAANNGNARVFNKKGK